MSYILKQKFNISELASVHGSPKKIVLLEPEYYARELLYKQLQEEGYGVYRAENMKHCSGLLLQHSPDLAVISPHYTKDFKSFLSELMEMRKTHTSIPVLTVGQSLPTEILTKIMDMGVTSHLDRSLTRPRDLVIIIKTILYV